MSENVLNAFAITSHIEKMMYTKYDNKTWDEYYRKAQDKKEIRIGFIEDKFELRLQEATKDPGLHSFWFWSSEVYDRPRCEDLAKEIRKHLAKSQLHQDFEKVETSVKVYPEEDNKECYAHIGIWINTNLKKPSFKFKYNLTNLNDLHSLEDFDRDSNGEILYQYEHPDPASFIINSVRSKLEAEKLERQAKLEAEKRERQAEIKRQNHIASKHNQLKEFVDKVAHLILQDESTVGDYANKIRPNLNEDFDINEVRNQIINYAIQNYAQENEENEYSNNFEDFVNAFNSVVLANCAEDADKKIKELDAYLRVKNFVNQYRWYLNQYDCWYEYQRYENHEENNIFDGAEGFWTILFSHGNTKTKSENAVVVLNKLLSDTKLSLENMYKDVSLEVMTTTHEDCPGYWVNVVVSYRYKK